MKFEVLIEGLLQGVSLATRFIQKQGSLPALSSVLMSADHGVIILRATNLECGVEIEIPAKVSTDGVAAIPSGALAGFLSNSRDKNITGVLQDGVLQVKTDHTTASIKTISSDEFPTLPRIGAEQSFTIKGSDFARALRSVLHCASTSTIKPELQSVLLFGEAGKLTCAATDSFRLAEKTTTLKSRGGVPHLLFPARNAAELLRIIENISSDLVFYFNDHQIAVQAGNVYYTSRLLDGTFPNYSQIIPKNFTTEAVLLREDLAQALRGLSVFTDRFMQVTFEIDPKRKSVELSSRNADVGEENCVLKATTTGEGGVMNFNSRYLADSLLPLSGESIRISSNGPGKPMLIQDAADSSYLYLAMPMNR